MTVDPLGLVASAVLLGGALAVAVGRPRGLPEAAGVVPAAGAVLLLGLVSPGEAADEVRQLLPTVGFLAAVLALAWLAGQEGLFAAVADRIAVAGRGRPVRLLGLVFATCAVVTAALSLDTTVVLLTPVVLSTVAAAGVAPRPHLYATVHLANSASLLLPVSNLTNLLAFSASGLGFLRFAALMALPWLVAVGVEWLAVRRVFRADLQRPAAVTATVRPRRLPAYPVGVIAVTLLGFAVASQAGLDPWVPATAGALALAVPALARRRVGVRGVLAAADPLFLVFVLGLAVVVKAVQVNGLDRLGAALPVSPSLPALLAVAGVAALLSNVVNNLPAVLLLLPALTGHPAALLAAVVGVNLGPNLTYAGSLATLLWTRTLRAAGAPVELRVFTRLGLASVPAGLLAATTALWLAVRVLGTG